ncbi:MAG: hypothetical protein ACREPW_05855 [Candidatus Binataceae bacterium]
MIDNLPEYKIFVIRYATRDARRADHFIGGGPHDAINDAVLMDFTKSASPRLG